MVKAHVSRVSSSPGVANGIADALSRMVEPGFIATIPEELKDIEPTVVPARTKHYYRILTTT